MLKLLFFASATYAADIASAGACICGTSCRMSATSLGTCQPGGECAVNILPPNCNGPVVSASLALAHPIGCPMFKCVAPSCALSLQETPTDAKGCKLCPRCPPSVGTIAALDVSSSLNLPKLDLTSGPSCPVFRCMMPNCAGNQFETPKDANGCPLCPKCAGVQLGPNVFSAGSAATTATVNPALNLDLDIKTSQPCPLLSCPPINCPPAFQEHVTGANGCPGCPRCRQLTGKNAGTAAGMSLGASLEYVTAAPVCPLINCVEPNCPVAQQEKTTLANGCPGCPRCRQITGKNAGTAAALGASLDLTAAPVCPLINCVAPNCPVAQQEKTTLANGCAGCPRCRQIGTGKGGKLGKAKGPTTITNPVDACALILCLPNSKCVNGACEPINPGPCATVRCAAGFMCVNGQCVANTYSSGR